MKYVLMTLAFLLSTVFIAGFRQSAVFAQFDAATNEACKGLAVDSQEFIDCEEGKGGSGINDVLAVTLNILSFVAGVIAVIMMVVAGIKFITSQGDSGAVSSARNTVIYALVGIVIVLLSQIIVRFVLTQAANGGSTTPPASTAPDCRNGADRC